MRYLDITTDDKRKALATLEGEKKRMSQKKWKDSSILASSPKKLITFKKKAKG